MDVDSPSDVRRWLTRWADEPYLYLSTVGRRSGQAHRIEIWFAVHEGRVYLMSGGRDRSDWVRNLKVNPGVAVELRDTSHSGEARIIASGSADDRLARELLVTKYARPDNDLNEWGRNSLPIVIEFPEAQEQSGDQ